MELIDGCSTSAGASNAVLEGLMGALGVRLPTDYVSLLTFSNGLEGFIGENYLMLYSAEDVQAYGVYEDEPFFVFIGSNGGGEGYAYDTRSPDMPIVNVPFIGLGETPRPMGESVLEFLERLHSRPLFD
jgi:hypothetical protein